MKKQKYTVKKYFLALVVFCAVFATATFIRAGVLDNMSGWGWGGSEDASIAGSMGTIDGNETGLGLISMNNANCDADSDKKSDGAVGCPVIGTPMENYGVSIPAVGALTGYAWSENVGYIDFAPHSGCPGSPKYPGACDAYPASPNQDATRNADNTITGWARIVDISKDFAIGNSGGWQGWIKLTGDTYGVTVSAGSLAGYAWNGEVIEAAGSNIGGGLGFISFSKSALPIVSSPTANPFFINIKTNPNWATAGVDITLSWDISGNISCTKSWDGGQASATGSSVFKQLDASKKYTLTCSGGIIKETIVSTGCYPQVCASQKCVNGTIKLGISDPNVCTSASMCAWDTDCETKAIETWKEVAP